MRTYIHTDGSRWYLARGFLYPEDGTIRSSETSVHARSIRHHIPEDGILNKMLLTNDIHGHDTTIRLTYPSTLRKYGSKSCVK
jgi:hypothetical protein